MRGIPNPPRRFPTLRGEAERAAAAVKFSVRHGGGGGHQRLESADAHERAGGRAGASPPADCAEGQQPADGGEVLYVSADESAERNGICPPEAPVFAG